MITRVPRELGRPRRLHRNCRPENRLTNSRMIHGLASRAAGDERGTQRWYRQAKETKRGEKGGGESERLIVPLSRGNRPEGPGEGRGRRVMNRWRETCRVRRDPRPGPAHFYDDLVNFAALRPR